MSAHSLVRHLYGGRLLVAFGILAAAGCSSDGSAELPDRSHVVELDQLGVTTVSDGNAVLSQRTQRFDSPGHVAPTQRWTQRTSGLCGQSCRNGPRHMYSAAFGDTLLVSWMAIDPEDPWRQYGNVATFRDDGSGTFTWVRNASFDGICAATYGITTNADGSIISVLCRGPDGDTTPLRQSLDLLRGRRNPASCSGTWEGTCYPIGNYSALDSALYILEFRSGSVTNLPDDIVYVNHAVGGWRYGHHEISLNEAEDTYFVHLKVTAGPTETNRHEGMTRFGVRRTPAWEYVPINDEWACGPGHVLANRLAYNSVHDRWGEACFIDSCAEPASFANRKCNSVTFSTVDAETSTSAAASLRYQSAGQLLDFDQADNAWNMSGGLSTVLSLGNDGWIALVAGTGLPDAAPKPNMLGTFVLPPTVAEIGQLPFAGGRYAWNWHAVPPPSTADGVTREPRVGNAAMAYFGSRSEDAALLLIGWSPSTAFQGITDEYVVSVADRAGNFQGAPYQLRNAGWGEDNRWETMPNSGCVVFPFAWIGDAPGGNYPIERNEAVAEEFPQQLYLTSICPKP